MSIAGTFNVASSRKPLSTKSMLSTFASLENSFKSRSLSLPSKSSIANRDLDKKKKKCNTINEHDQHKG